MSNLRSIALLLVVGLAFGISGCTSGNKKQKNGDDGEQANILYILTDDHRYDAVRAFNKALHDREMSELGYVESPNIDRLAAMGTTFINTYCQAQGCAPSRSSMHLGRYPFRSGIYEFEYYNNNAEHFEPSMPEQLVELGYQTLRIGKLGVRIKTIDGDRSVPFHIYQNNIDFKALHRDGYTAWGKDWIKKIEGLEFDAPLKNTEYFVTPEGEFQYISRELEEKNQEYAGTAQKAMEEYDLLRHYNNKKGPKSPFNSGILGGVSSRKAGETRDGYYASIFADYLKNTDSTFTIGSQTIEGIDESKPQFFYIGFDFPHTPVLPPADYRARFQEHSYKVPELAENELATMPAQQRKQVENGFTDHFTDEEKQSMIQDYFAFCAYGDALVGQAVDDFIAYNEEKGKEWVIVYVNGDHGWKLNDHGSVSKFSPWDIDAHNPIVVVSSDKKAYPAGKIVYDFTEFVDVTATIIGAAGADLEEEKYEYLDGFNLAEVVSGDAPVRDYVVGESHAVTGPRAYIRTKEYMFSMQTRPDKVRGKDMDWARNASYEELDPGLYHFTKDPHEINNLAYDEEYQEIAMAMKEKLMNIVLGDNRVEVSWGKNITGTEVHRSNFAPGSHDYKLELPSVEP